MRPACWRWRPRHRGLFPFAPFRVSCDAFGKFVSAWTPKPAREGHDLMTWVTVQSHDIGDTFLGIYALEKVFGVGGADAICSCGQEQERVVRVGVWSVWDQSQERLQVVAALSGRWSKSFGGWVATAASPRENARFLLADAFAQDAPGASALGSEKAAAAFAKSFFSSPTHSGGEHVGALAGGVAFSKEAASSGAARTALAVEGSTGAHRLQPSMDDRLQRLVSHGRWAALRTAYCARSVSVVLCWWWRSYPTKAMLLCAERS